jgi:Phosphatidylglycerophosphate synthase
MFCAVLLLQVNPFLPCVTLFALIALSDYFDGKLARKYNVQTSTGAILDVMTDFFFIVTACFSLSQRGQFLYWMLAVIVFKFLEFWITSAFFKRNYKNTTVFLFDPLGRVVAVLFYLLPVLVLLLQFCFPAQVYPIAIEIICAGLTMLTVVSSSFRITLFVKSLMQRVRKCC